MPRIKERRRRPRVNVALPIKLAYNKVKILTVTKNISILGTYLETDKDIPRGTILDIRIAIPKTGLKKVRKIRQINCTGVVFRCQTSFSAKLKKQYGIAIFFRSFLKGEKELSSYIDYLLLQEKRMGQIYIRKRKQKFLIQKGGKR